jgi:ADP-heptose:LPS heptosyltransferase
VRRVLVIRLGALGDFVLSFPAFAAIRAHHASAHVTLLTTSPFAELARAAPWFDAVLIDRRPAWWDVAGLLRLRRQLRGFDLVYDLQTSSRSSAYFRLAGRPAWSGIAAGCALPHANRARDFMHTLERQHEQLAMAGIDSFPAPDLGWLAAQPLRFGLPERFVLLVPGAAPHRARKRWPAPRYGELAKYLAGRGLTPVVLGAAREAPLAKAIREVCKQALDLTGRTTIADIAALAARAAVAIGNDTGPMHVAAAMGCPSLVLFSADSDPALTAPRGSGGSWPGIIRVDDLRALGVERVIAELASGRLAGQPASPG